MAQIVRGILQYSVTSVALENMKYGRPVFFPYYKLTNNYNSPKTAESIDVAYEALHPSVIYDIVSYCCWQVRAADL